MIIRPAIGADASALALMHVQTWQAAYRGIVPDEQLDKMNVAKRADGWRDVLANSTGNNLVAQTGDDEIAGFVSFGTVRNAPSGLPNGRTAEIYVLYVHPNYWRGGWGRALLETALDALCKESYTVVILWTWERNERACAFYERTGWVLHGEPVVDSRFGLPLAEVCYRKEISSALTISELA